MSIRFSSTALVTVFAAGAAFGDMPDVVADIAPVHSLVARVMDGVGSPELILPQEASPHGFALRPSQASALQNAELVLRVGEGLTPWLGEALDTLAPEAKTVELMEVEDTFLLPIRVGATFEAHDHDDHEDDHDAHEDHDDHDEHDEHGHEEDGHDDHDGHANHADHDAHEEDHADAHGGDHEGHDHSGIDPHAWLDPLNAATWARAIAEELAQADPENASTYRANADELVAELGSLTADLNASISANPPAGFVVFHDAYQYFETRFGFAPLGAISVPDASAPSAGRVAEVRARITELGGTCVFAEPQFDPRIVATVTEGTEAGTAVIDPLGSTLDLGPALYPQLIRNMAQSFQSCS